MSALTGVTWLLQVVVPAALVGRLTLTSATDSLERILEWAFAVVYAAAIGLAGLWLALPWYTPALYLAVLLALLPTLVTVRRGSPSGKPNVRGIMPRLAALVSAGAVLAAVSGGRRPVEGAVDLAFPLSGGPYLVAAAGSSLWLNPHLKTLDAERFPDFTGQSHAVDLVKVGRWGSRVGITPPRHDTDYAIFGETVHAPCSGRVWRAVDGDPRSLPGNHVILDCAGVHVVLAHLDGGSVAVVEGQGVRTGDPVGRVGNSGRSGEPHLHIHAQTPGDAAAPLSGRPIPITFEGRYLARNDRVRGNRWNADSRSNGQAPTAPHRPNTELN